MRKLTVDDIVDHRAYERERDEFRAGIIAMKKRRRIALGDLVTDRVREHRHHAVPGAGDGAGRAHAHRRGDRPRGRDLQRADPRSPASCRARCSSSSPTTPLLREWLPKLIGHRVPRVLRAGRARERVAGAGRPERRGAPHPRRHHVDRALPKFPFDARAAGRVRERIRPVGDRPPRVQGVGRAQRRRSAPSSPATSPTDAVEIRVQRLDPDLPLPRQQHTDDAGYDLHARERVELAAGGGRALVPTGLAIAIPSGYAGFVLPRSGLALQVRHHVPQHAGAHRLPVPRRAEGVAGEHRPERALYRRARRPHRAAGDPAGRAGRLAGSRASSTPPSATRSASGRRECDGMGTRRGSSGSACRRRPRARARSGPSRRARSKASGTRRCSCPTTSSTPRWRRWSRLPFAAAATTTLRIGMLVLGNDYKHPAVVAKEAATLDVLSDGRLEFGLGAGWMTADYDALGLPYDRPGLRIERLAEALAVVKGAVGDGAVRLRRRPLPDHRVRRRSPKPLQQPRPPIVVGGGGPKLLRLAGREADIVGINPNLRAGEIGAEAAQTRSATPPAARSSGSAKGAGERFDDLELQIRYFVAAITDDAQALAEAMAPGVRGRPRRGAGVGRRAGRLGRRGVRHARRAARGVGRVVRRARRRQLRGSSPRSWPASPGPDAGPPALSSSPTRTWLSW